MPRLDLYLLGPPRIDVDGAPVKADTRKALALIAWLAVTSRTQQRAAAADLLWCDYPPSRGRANLRRTLYALRQAIGTGWLVADYDTLCLSESADLWVDLTEFRQLLGACKRDGHHTTVLCAVCAKAHARAVSLYRGDLLAGFDIRDSQAFDEWHRSEGEGWRLEMIGALQKLVGWHSAQGTAELALSHARRWLHLDPLNEGAHRQLMRLYAAQGHRAAALYQYRNCVQLLREELGISPEERTRALHHSIVQGKRISLAPHL